MRACTVLLAAALLAVTTSSPTKLRTTARVANFGDVAHTFDSAYQFSEQCPDKIEIAKLTSKERNIGVVLLSDIKEDGQVCTGKGTKKMNIVTENTAKRQQLLKDLGFRKAASALANNEANPAAKAAVENSNNKSSLLVGFDEGQRTCGAATWSSSSFFFFINEPKEFRFDIQTSKEKALVTIILPPNTRALWASDGDRKICLLYDKSSVTSGQEVKVVAQNQQGKVIPVTTTTATASPTPTPSTSTLISPSPSPSEGAIVVSRATPPAVADITVEPSAAPSGGSVCFPAHVSVELASGRHVPISTLRLGDRVRTGAEKFSDVFMFTHNEASVRHGFLRLVTRAGRAVTLTESHYLMASGRLTAAGNVRVGDMLQLADGTTSSVSSIEHITSTGLYNPQTLDGSLVVDGVVTSCYTTAVHIGAAHGALLAPLRVVYLRVGAKGALNALSSVIGRSAEWLGGWMPSGSPVLG